MSNPKKGKAPAFQFYADDFLAGTSEMSVEEVGAYIRLLCHQWTKGGLPDDQERIARIAGVSVLPMAPAWLCYVVAKFPLMADGMRRNSRLEDVRAEQVAYRAKKSQAGKLGADSRWNEWQPDGTAIGKPMAQPLANESQTDGPPVSGLLSPITTPKPPKPKPAPSSPEWEGFAEFWSAYPKRTGKPQAIKAWNKLKPSPELRVEILQAIQVARRSDQWTKDGGQFIPYPASYLNGRRWEDEVESLTPVVKDWRQMTPEEIIRESVG